MRRRRANAASLKDVFLGMIEVVGNAPLLHP